MPARGGIFFGWYVVTACFLILFAATGVGFFTFSVFMIPLEHSFQASRTAITAINSITALVAGFAAPLVGMLIHSWGARRVIGSGAALTGGAFLLMSMATSLWHLYLFGALLGAGLAATTIVPIQTLVSHWFVRKRGTAMGSFNASFNFGITFFAFGFGVIAKYFGFPVMYVVSGIGLWVAAVGLALDWFKSSGGKR